MSKLIRLNDNVYIDPDTVCEVVRVDDYKDYLKVVLNSGTAHRVDCDYGKSVWDTQTRIVNLINGARTDAQPT